VLEITLFIIFLIVVFIAASWYAHYRGQKIRESLLLDDEPYRDEVEEQSIDSGFAAVLDEEIQHQINTQVDDIENEPEVTLSADAENLTQQTQAKTAQRKEPSFEAKIDDDDIDIDITTAQNSTQTEPQFVTEPAKQQAENDWDMVIAFTVMAREGHSFSGKTVKAIFERLDLHFGEDQIFHRMMVGPQKQTLFSVANVLDPGTLLPDNFSTMSTPGLVVFATLPGPLNGLLLFDEVLDAARQMTDYLNGILCDEKRQPLSPDDIEILRGKILNMNMSMQQADDIF
jgi:cell division protein ZipA